MSLDQIGRGRTTSRAKSMCKGWGGTFRGVSECAFRTAGVENGRDRR